MIFLSSPDKALTYGRASDEGIAREFLLTRANWTSIDDVTSGVCSAGSGARVSALLIDAGAIGRTIRAAGALGSTIWR